MIRFVDIGTQIGGLEEDGSECQCFAFFDTVINRFCAFADEQVFDSLADFLEAWSLEHASANPERFVSKIPAKYGGQGIDYVALKGAR